MALTDNIVNNASLPQAEANNLLTFVNLASSSIHEALGKQSKKRNVNVRKYIQKKVKRLNGKGSKSSSTNNIGNSQTKPKKATIKPSTASVLKQLGSRSCPQLVTTNIDVQPPRLPVQTMAMPTSAYPTHVPPPLQYSYSEPSLYSRALPFDNKVIDPELDNLLSEFELQSPSTSHRSSESAQTSLSPSFTPGPTLENQVYIAEHPYSPYSDYSDDVYDDSAYSSPGSVNYRTNNCSPPIPSSTVSPVCADFAIHSPLNTIATPPCPVSTQASDPNWVQAISSSGWIPEYAASVTSMATIDHGPPMTPTVSQLLLDTYF